MGLPPTKLLLVLTEQLLVQQIVSLEASFPCKALGAVKSVNNLYFFLYALWTKIAVREQHQPVACPCRKHVGGYTAGVCVITNISLKHVSPYVPGSLFALILSSTVNFHD